MAAGPVVIKVGGSLYDLPELPVRLRRCLEGLGGYPTVLVPGGGPAADVVRDLDHRFRLGEEAAHWLALRALSLNAHFLSQLLPGATVCDGPDACGAAFSPGSVAILDAHAFARADDGRPGCLPHVWEATSDSLAARVAVVVRASRLILLKSVPIPAGMDWGEAGRAGLVDPLFAGVIEQAGPDLLVEAVTLRADRWETPTCVRPA
jgi:aspartokinase-like uncharacterized kinase